MYNTPSGEVLPFLVGIGIDWFAATVLSGAIIGAAISMGIYILQATINNNFSLGGFAKSILLGAATGAVSAGLGEVFSASGFWSTVANGALTGAGTGGVTALITGQNFLEGVLKGAVIDGGVAGISWGISKLYNSSAEFGYSSDETGVIDAVGDKPLTQKEVKDSFQQWKEPYKSYEFRQKVYLAAQGEVPPGYGLNDTGTAFINGDTKAGAVTVTKYSSKIKGSSAMESTIYVVPKVYSTPQLNYYFNHEFGHVVINHTYGYNNIWNQLTNSSNILMDSFDHIAIQKMGSEFLKKNNWNNLNLKGVFGGYFIGGHTPDPELMRLLEKLIIKIK